MCSSSSRPALRCPQRHISPQSQRLAHHSSHGRALSARQVLHWSRRRPALHRTPSAPHVRVWPSQALAWLHQGPMQIAACTVPIGKAQVLARWLYSLCGHIDVVAQSPPRVLARPTLRFEGDASRHRICDSAACVGPAGHDVPHVVRHGVEQHSRYGRRQPRQRRQGAQRGELRETDSEVGFPVFGGAVGWDVQVDNATLEADSIDCDCAANECEDNHGCEGEVGGGPARSAEGTATVAMRATLARW